MGVLYETLTGLSPFHDAELLEGYQRYEELLAAILTSEQMVEYAEFVRQTGTIRVFEELTPEELEALPLEENVIALSVMADETASMENRRVAALLNQRGQHETAPDLAPIAG